MNEQINLKTTLMSRNELMKTKGGIPILPVLGAITAAVSFGKIMDQAGEWFLEGWNEPK
ncbi:hypothetical protein [Lutimonas zeaxanthinifaciens]|uniref:hypothetical protein n=1 Tax=Lutimonas zeaxanthinifaciens TaxID=3060215 RepID=UPI00265D3986|nr:hypothetical protein [Lutimonas sp. YSD2104]WKK66006.1 hypothetical protein QZH61_15635 [Lutimonas sp. YSD2104]